MSGVSSSTTRRVRRLAADPASGQAGDVYFNTTLHVPRYFNGSFWGNADGTRRKYVALMSAPALGDPNADTVLHNSLGEVVWTRASAGVYHGTLAGAFPAGKVAAFVSIRPTGGDAYHAYAERGDDDTIVLSVFDIAGAAEDGFNFLALAVYVYP